MYSDEYLEYMGELFCEYDLYQKHNIRFDTFLIHHKDILETLNRMEAIAC